MNVQNTIKSLLYKHDCVIVPDFGGFVAKQSSAIFQPMDYTFHPPSKKIGFNSNLKHTDGLLANAVANKQQITYEEAMEQIAAMVASWQNALAKGEEVYIEELGTFVSVHDHIAFHPVANQNFSVDTFGLNSLKGEYILRNKEEKDEAPSSNTWISYAAAVGFALIVGGSAFFANNNLVQPQLSSFLPMLNTEEVAKPAPQPVAPVIDIEAMQIASHETPTLLQDDMDAMITDETDKVDVVEHVDETEVDLSVKKFQVIGGSFKVYSRAMEHQAKLKREGYNRAIIVGKVGNFYMVAFDTFHNEADAIAYKRELEKQGHDVFMRH